MNVRLSWACLAVVVVAAAACGRAGAESPFRVDGDRPTRAVVTVSAAPAGEAVAACAMAERVSGRLAVLERRDLQALLEAAPLNPPPVGVTANERVVVCLHLERGERTRVVEVVRAGDGSLLARDAGSPERADARARLIPGRFEALMAGWSAYRGGFEGPAEEASAGAQPLEGPLEPSAITLDESTIGERVYRGMRVRFEAASRDLAEESMNARLPAGYTARSPAALLVWVSPTENAIPPAELDPVLDELGMIVIGVNRTGNERPVFERMQLALDAVATASARWHVDPERVYVAGWSGGGRTSSMLWGTFPEVFRGGAAIVGLSSFYEAKAGPGKVWPRAYARPRGDALRLLREQRLAIVTGTRDFNDANTSAQARMMERDRLAVRVFAYDMGHEVPNAERLSEVLRWMDEPARERRKQEAFEAQQLLGAYLASHPGDGASDGRGREQLVRVMEVGPWSASAWVALDILSGEGVSGGGGGGGADGDEVVGDE